MADTVHGTLRAYVIDKCRCGACTEANRAYANRANRLRAYGQWAPFVDAQPAREHLALLADYGIGWKRAGQLAGVSCGTVSRLLYGAPGRQPTRRIRPETETRILAVRPILANLADQAVVDATGVGRRIHALVARGFPFSFLAGRLGMKLTNFARIARCPSHVSAATARAVISLYEELWDADPTALGVEARFALRAAGKAAKAGWLPPMAWGEEIDDPAFVPELVDGTPRPLAIAENVEFIRRTTGVEDLSLIAERLGMKRDTLDRNLDRAKVLTRELVAA